jgi:signal transduction histidine kinase
LQELCRQLPDDAAIVLNTQADLPDCLTDRKLLGIVLFNLLDNAIKYRATDSAIEVAVSLQPEGERVGLQVSVSNMAGLAGWPDAERVFKKYWRGAAATRWAGSGLGLYLSGLIAKRLGGDLRYRPDETHVRFELWLPI